MNKQYEKPFMKMVSLRSNESVADTCWGNHGPDTQRYWDTAGKGYVAFYCANTNCNMKDQSDLVVWYYDKKNDDEPELLKTSDSLHGKVYEAVKAGGNSGNPLRGMKDFPDTPGGMS